MYKDLLVTKKNLQVLLFRVVYAWSFCVVGRSGGQSGGRSRTGSVQQNLV